MLLQYIDEVIGAKPAEANDDERATNEEDEEIGMSK